MASGAWSARFREALFEMIAGRTGDDIGGLHVQFHQELRERDDVVGIAHDGHAFAVEVLVHVAHGVEQAAAFLANGGGHIHAAVVAERVDETVGVREAVGQFQQRAGTLHFSSSSMAAGCEAKWPSAIVPTLSPADLICSTVAPPLREHPVTSVLRQIQHAAGVGEHDGLTPISLTMRLSSRMSAGSMKPGMRFNCRHPSIAPRFCRWIRRGISPCR
jgi:hypothetical protein